MTISLYGLSVPRSTTYLRRRSLAGFSMSCYHHYRQMAPLWNTNALRSPANKWSPDIKLGLEQNVSCLKQDGPTGRTRGRLGLLATRNRCDACPCQASLSVLPEQFPLRLNPSELQLLSAVPQLSRESNHRGLDRLGL